MKIPTIPDFLHIGPNTYHPYYGQRATIELQDTSLKNGTVRLITLGISAAAVAINFEEASERPLKLWEISWQAERRQRVDCISKDLGFTFIQNTVTV
jgi:hypothetical protein